MAKAIGLMELHWYIILTLLKLLEEKINLPKISFTIFLMALNRTYKKRHRGLSLASKDANLLQRS
jgi:hypothetical protein